ncbi:ABC transporter permease [Candidatus Woesearchaeota archaeon]|nr:ABC transporter permease [Candidatus Woesearchaeota archaeon]
MIRQVLKIISKNLKLLLRSKSSASVVILGPLLLMFLVGVAFNNNAQLKLNIGVYAEEYTTLTENVIASLDNDRFEVLRFDAEQTCVRNTELGVTHACIVLPKDLKIEEGKTNEILFYVDYSRINIVYNILDQVSTQFSTISKNLSIDLTNTLIDKFNEVKDHVDDDKTLVEGLKSREDDLKKDLADLKEGLDKMDLSIATNGTSISTIRTDISELNNYFDDVTDDAEDVVEFVIDNPDTWGSNNSLKTMAEDLQDLIIDAKNDTINLTTDQLMAKISAAMDDMGSKLEQANKIKGTAKSDIVEAQSSVDKTIGKLDDLKESLTQAQNIIDNIAVKDAESIVNPISTRIESISSKGTRLNYLFPSLMALVVMFISLMIPSLIIVMEKNYEAHFRNFVTPTGDFAFLTGTFFTNFVLLMLQLVIILTVAGFFFRDTMLATLPAILLILVLLIVLFSLIGMGIGHVFNSQETVTIGAVSVASMFMLLSDFILPLESMPYYAQAVAAYNPFVIGSSLLRKTLLFNTPLSDLSLNIYVLLAYSFIIFILMVATQKFMRLRFMHRYSNKAKTKQKKAALPPKEGVKVTPYKKRKNLSISIKPENYFKLHSGITIKNLKELKHELAEMDSHTFEFYVNGSKNDFANWVAEVLQKKKLAEELRSCKTKEEMMKLL